MRTESFEPTPGPDAGDRASFMARDLGEAAREQAHAAWQDAKAAARDKLSEQKDATASGVGDFATALHDAAERLERQRHPEVARFAHTAAGGLERLAATLQGKDIDVLVRDTEDFARRQPVAFFAGAVAAGFFAVRFLKSSERARERDALDARTAAATRRPAPDR